MFRWIWSFLIFTPGPLQHGTRHTRIRVPLRAYRTCKTLHKPNGKFTLWCRVCQISQISPVRCNRCVAACCSVIQCAAVCCSVFQFVAVRCNRFPISPVYVRHVLGPVAGKGWWFGMFETKLRMKHCNTLQHTATHTCCTAVSLPFILSPRHHTAPHCTTLQHPALQHTATHCNALQHTCYTAMISLFNSRYYFPFLSRLNKSCRTYCFFILHALHTATDCNTL